MADISFIFILNFVLIPISTIELLSYKAMQLFIDIEILYWNIMNRIYKAWQMACHVTL